MSEVVLRTTGLVKDYGRLRALRGVDLQVERGEVFGFLGPNGAGKSTTIRILLGLLRATAGTATILGHPVFHDPAVRARIGYLPGELALAGNRTAGEHLGYLARLRGGRGTERIVPLAQRFGLDLERRFAGLSKGNKQKVGVVQAFMHTPELLILDEPTSGLDPLLQQEFLELVVEAQRGGATVFMSSHVLGEVDAVAQRVAVIREGAIVDVDGIHALRSRAGQRIELRFASAVAAAEFAGLDGLSDISMTGTGRGTTLTAVLRGSPDRLLKVAAGHEVVGWSAADRSLDELFLEFYETKETSVVH